MDRPVDRQTGFAQADFPWTCADLCCCVEAERQACALLAQTADAITTGTEEVQVKLLQNAGELLDMGFGLAERLFCSRMSRRSASRADRVSGKRGALLRQANSRPPAPHNSVRPA